MRVVAALIAEDSTLTDAALGVGFADSSRPQPGLFAICSASLLTVFGRAANVRIVIAQSHVPMPI